MRLQFSSLMVCCLILNGCSVYMAAHQPDEKNLIVLTSGQKRAVVIGELGAPILTTSKDGRLVDYFKFKQGYSTTTKTVRTVSHAVLDVFTIGIWEAAGTPIETRYSGQNMAYEVIYDENECVERVILLQKN